MATFLEEYGVDFNAYKESIKGYIAQGVSTLSEYKQYFGEQFASWSAWSGQQLSAALTWSQAQFSSLLTWAGGWLQTGMEYARWFISNVFNGNFIRQAVDLFIKGYNIGYDFMASLLTNLYNVMARLASNVRYFLVEAAKLIWNGLGYLKDGFIALGKAIVNNLYHFISHIPEYLNNLYVFAKELVVFARDRCFELFNFFKSAAQLLWNFAREIASVAWNILFEGAKFLIQKTARTLLVSVAVVYGLSAALVDYAALNLSSLINATLGLSFPSLATLGYLKFGLSVGLAGFAVYQVGKFSYYGIAALFGLTQATRLLPTHQNNAQPDTNVPAPAAAVAHDAAGDLALDQPPAPTLTAQFDALFMQPAAANTDPVPGDLVFGADVNRAPALT